MSGWEENITKNLKKTRWEVVDCTDPDQDRNKCFDLVKNAENLRVPQNARDFLTNWETTSFSRITT
jgi:hypothetical protein